MSHSVRFIGLALGGWIVVRALSLGVIPGGEAFAFDRPSGLDRKRAPLGLAPSGLPPLAATQFAPLDPITPDPAASDGAAPLDQAQAAEQRSSYSYAPAYPRPYAPAYQANYAPAYAPAYGGAGQSRALRVYAAMPTPRPRMALADDGFGWPLPEAPARYAAATPPLDQWPIERIAAGRGGGSASLPGQSPALVRPALDRLSMSSWAMLRRAEGPSSLAANGMLGGSQAGARILYRFTPRFAASVRTSAPIGGTTRGGEVAAGLRWQPLRNVPVAFTAEGRKAFGTGVGRSGLAVFVEGGVYQRPILAGFNLDAYLQSGVVGVRRRQYFVDGSATLTRPVWRQLSIGGGMWGGAQTALGASKLAGGSFTSGGLARLDVGPRLTWRVGRSMKVHVDYRHRLVGRAAPGSGPVLTLVGDF